MRRREYVPGRVVQQQEVKIPSGYNCLKCKAKGRLAYPGSTSTAFGRDVCLLYGIELTKHGRRVSNTRDPWGHNKTAEVVEKCQPCRDGVDPAEFRKGGGQL